MPASWSAIRTCLEDDDCQFLNLFVHVYGAYLFHKVFASLLSMYMAKSHSGILFKSRDGYKNGCVCR